MLPSHYQGRQTLRVKEVVAVSGIARTKIYQLIGDGTLRTIKVGRARLVLRSSLDELLSPEPLDKNSARGTPGGTEPSDALAFQTKGPAAKGRKAGAV